MMRYGLPTTSDAAIHIRLAEVLGALSHALDMTEGQPAGHCIRCCWIGMRIADILHLDAGQQRELYYAILLKDLGCSSNAARICQLYLTDDLSFKQDFKLIDGSLPQALRFVLSHTGLTASLAERFRAIYNILRNGGDVVTELIETRCQRGADIARRLRFSDGVAKAIAALDEHWDGNGKPHRVARGAIPLYSRIALLAQVVDVFQIASGPEAARAEALDRAGTWFDPEIVSAFDTLAADPQFWLQLNSAELKRDIYACEPALLAQFIDAEYLDDIAAGFAQIVDAKSPYTSGHSERVTLYADMIAEQLGLASGHRRWLKRAALLHDIGKLGVSNGILDKPGKLTDDEWVAMKRHAAHTEHILSRISAFEGFAAVAAAHHERLDGKGYPKGLAGDQIVLESRILAVADIFDALTADRPYRAAMPIPRALSIMSEGVGTATDPDCFNALLKALDRIDAKAA